MTIVLSTYATLPNGEEFAHKTSNVPVGEWEQLDHAGRCEAAREAAVSGLAATRFWSKAASYGWTLTVDGREYTSGVRDLEPMGDLFDAVR